MLEVRSREAERERRDKRAERERERSPCFLIPDGSTVASPKKPHSNGIVELLVESSTEHVEGSTLVE
jgi:hypothetical protein